ncbi:MAG: alpha/beta hydrolase [Gordonia sp. (in: high G+C Gram-positive bacteria)]|uniref:alpha/beta hydrolase family protein n=1 Tax=Gordonia sp. (in: high G+C Gram-positive bacteria) TaxID=84139 RepID=UPI003C77EB2B
MSRKKMALAALGTILALALGLVVWLLVAKDYAIAEEHVTIEGPRGELHAVLAKPVQDANPHGVVIFVQDRGPNDADTGTYRPIWDAYAKAGFAVLSWDKPGVDGAPGNWLNQTIHDRVSEVQSVISWAYKRPDLDTTRIGIWGEGQAGFVVPEVLAARSDIRFATLVGPSTNWIHDRLFAVRADLTARGDSTTEVAAAVDRRDRFFTLLESGSNYQTYVRSGIDSPPMLAPAFAFAERNFRADAANAVARISTPLLLVLGGEDRAVDITQTESLYRSKMRSDLLTVKTFADATHTITRNQIEYRDDFRVSARTLFAPTSVYAPGYLDTLRIFAKHAIA